MNKKTLRKSYFRILKFMLIGIIPSLFLYYFLSSELPNWLLTVLNILIFVACGFVGEVIYLKIRNKEVLKELENDKEKK